MSSDTVIRVSKLSKSFPIYARPADRLKQFILPRIRYLLRLAPKQYYKTFKALSDISFEIRRGETVGIVGRNGAGKSTMLQILCGTLHPTSGEVEVKGRIAALLELGAGFSSEYSGRENIYMNARILGLTEEEINARFSLIVAFADIGEHLDQPVKTYSSGMYIRLAFAVIAHVDADILIVDEALAVGDSFFNQKCMRFLQEFKAHGTLVFVTHDPDALKALCDKSIWIDKGCLVSIGSTKSVSENYLAHRYSGEQVFATNSYPSTPAINSSFGTQKIVIEEITVVNTNAMKPVLFKGGEQTIIRFKMNARQEVAQVICGFNLKNRWGQVIFGENTLSEYAQSPYKVNVGDVFFCSFSFKMPTLATGIYSLDIAVAEGDALWHDQLHWIHDAAVIEFFHEKLSNNILRIDCDKIEMTVTEI